MRKELLYSIFFLLIVSLFFFYPVFKGFIPFPGDTLANENPYKSESFFGYTPSGYPNKAQGRDVYTEIYPWKYFSIQELKKGELPFWNPHNFSGNPHLANFQTGIFYPLNSIYFIFPFTIAWTLFIFSQPLLSALFMFLFLRRGLRLNPFAALLGGISFAFCSYMTVWMEYGNIGSTLLWLPLILLQIKLLTTRVSLIHFLILVFSLVFAILAGYIQGVFYIYVFSFFYILFLLRAVKKERQQIAFIFLIAFFLPILLTLFQVLPTLALFNESTRKAYSVFQLTTLLNPLYYWVTILIPDFFGNPATRNFWFNGTYIERVMYPGIGMVFFSFVAIFSSKVKEKNFFLISSIVSLLITTNLPFISLIYQIPLPVLSTTVPTRALSIFMFSLIVLGSFGIDAWMKRKQYIPKKIVLVFSLIIASIWLSVFILSRTSLLQQNYHVTLHNMILPTVLSVVLILLFFSRQKFPRMCLAILFLLIIGDHFYFFQKITPFAPPALAYPQTPVMKFIEKNAGINRFWGYGDGYILSDFQSVDGTYSPEGNDPLHVSSYTELLASSQTGKLPDLLPRPDANIAPGYGTDELKGNKYRKRILDLLGVKYILERNSNPGADTVTFPVDTYQRIFSDKDWQVYENKSALARFFLTNRYTVSLHPRDALDAVYLAKDIAKTVILSRKPTQYIAAHATGSAKLLLYTPNTVQIKTNTTGNELLFLSDNYYPEWQAMIDGNVTPIFLSDYSFRSVIVPGGDHVVTFSYVPSQFQKGLFVSGCGLILLLITSIFIVRYEKKLS